MAEQVVEVNEKYELTTDKIRIGNTNLYRIKAISDFGEVKTGDYGGYIEKEDNLSFKEGELAWVKDRAIVYGDARISGNAIVQDYAIVSDSVTITDNAVVGGNSRVSGNVSVSEYGKVYGNAIVKDSAKVYGHGEVFGNARLYERGYVFDYGKLYGNAWLYGDGQLYDNSEVFGNVQIFGCAWVHGTSKVYENIRLSGLVTVINSEVFGNGWFDSEVRIVWDDRLYNNTQFVGNSRMCSLMLEYIDGRFTYPSN